MNLFTDHIRALLNFSSIKKGREKCFKSFYWFSHRTKFIALFYSCGFFDWWMFLLIYESITSYLPSFYRYYSTPSIVMWLTSAAWNWSKAFFHNKKFRRNLSFLTVVKLERFESKILLLQHQTMRHRLWQFDM